MSICLSATPLYYYCGCNKVVTRDHSRSAKYINYLEKELALLEPMLGSERAIEQLHWGGGTPTFLSHDQMARLVAALDAASSAARGPSARSRSTRAGASGTMNVLAGLGFNRGLDRRAGLRPGGTEGGQPHPERGE